MGFRVYELMGFGGLWVNRF